MGAARRRWARAASAEEGPRGAGGGEAARQEYVLVGVYKHLSSHEYRIKYW